MEVKALARAAISYRGFLHRKGNDGVATTFVIHLAAEINSEQRQDFAIADGEGTAEQVADLRPRLDLLRWPDPERE